MDLMDFRVIAKVEGLFGGEKTEEEEIIASNPAEARELAQKRFPRSKELLLYQLLGKGEKPEFLGQEYSRSWQRDRDTGWHRTIPGKRLPMSVASDRATDQELLK